MSIPIIFYCIIDTTVYLYIYIINLIVVTKNCSFSYFFFIVNRHSCVLLLRKNLQIIEINSL